MGMDVYGKNPGIYFCRNVWGWRPLADFCLELAPYVTAACETWHSNDGDGLDAADAAALARKLRAALADGRAASYVTARDAALNALPDERCDLCAGTGIRNDDLGRKMGLPNRIIDEPGHPRHGQTGWCNGCDGRGNTRPFATHYHLEFSDIEEFATFLETSGGFEIH